MALLIEIPQSQLMGHCCSCFKNYFIIRALIIMGHYFGILRPGSSKVWKEDARKKIAKESFSRNAAIILHMQILCTC